MSWSDGVTVAEVETISKKYQGGSFDGMTDCYNYSTDAWNEAFGSAMYVQTSRNYSSDFVTETIAEIGAEWHGENLPTADDYRNGHLFSISPSRHCDTWQHLIYRAIYKKSAIK